MKKLYTQNEITKETGYNRESLRQFRYGFNGAKAILPENEMWFSERGAIKYLPAAVKLLKRRKKTIKIGRPKKIENIW